MCGRFGLDIRPNAFREHFGVADPPVLAPRYNIAPSQDAACVMVHPDSGERVVRKLRFGLIPHWARDAKIGYKLINARSETAHKKPAFCDAFAKRRLIVPATGFYEWRKDNGKRPWFYGMEGGAPMGLAGIWDRWRDKGSGETVFSFAILTVPANDLVARAHERMPAILSPDAYSAWLRSDTNRETLGELLSPYPPEAMSAWAVSRRVNSPDNDDPSLIEPEEGTEA